MENPTRLIADHPYATLFLAVLAEQIGLPFPGVVFLLAAGAVAAAGGGHLGAFLVTGIVATLLADLVWYAIGRRRGDSLTSFITWLSPDPDGYAQRIYRTFADRAERVLVWAKFVPNLSTVTTPLAGAARMPLSRFLVFDGIGTVLWNGAFLTLGFVVGPEVVRIFRGGHELGAAPALLLLAGLAGAVAWRTLRKPEAAPALVPVEHGHAGAGR